MKCWDSRALFKSTSPSPTKKKKRESFCLCILTGDVLSLMKPAFSLYNPRCMCPLHMERPGAIASGLDCQALSAEAGSQASVCVWGLPAQSWELNSGHLAVSFPRGLCNLPPFLFAFVGSFLGSLLSPEARPVAIKWSSSTAGCFSGSVAAGAPRAVSVSLRFDFLACLTLGVVPFLLSCEEFSFLFTQS